MASTVALPPDSAALEERTYAKVTRRLIPLIFFCYILSYLDRVNIGFAKLQMLSDLQFSEAVYGLGAGIFFIGYFIFEIPSNLLLHKVGARRWIARIMISWGLISAAMMFVTTPTMFYVMRFLLGVAEAGFFPGVILYLTYWFPSDRRGRVSALFMTAIPISGVIGSPLSGWIMEAFAGMNGWAGWQWLFLLEGLPTVFVGIYVLFYLDDSIAKAKWLSPEEKELLSANIASDQQAASSHSFGDALKDPKIWILSAVYFGVIMGLYGISFWLPSLVKATGVQSATQIGLLTAIPYAAATIAMVLVSRSSDRYRERRYHFALPCVLGAVGLVLSTVYASHTVLALAALSLACAGIMAGLPVFWSSPTAFLGGAAAAGGIALINSIGNLAGFASPYMVGFIKEATQSTDSGMYALSVCLVISAILIVTLVPARMVNR